MIVLGIESTCDETAAALVEDGRHLLSNVISTSVKEQALYGGVVPEIASRRHCEFISATVKKALLDAGKTMDDVDAVAVTFAPGLIGAVLVGVNFAKGLAYSAGKPLVPVHHLRGHIAALYLTHPELKPPFLCLVASGGHSHIVEVQDYTHYHILGHTVDDAAGEAFDKVARTLGLPYPGGPSVANAAKTGDPKAYRLPVPHVEGKYNVSFSGLKTAVLNEVNKAQMKGEAVNVPDLAASFQAHCGHPGRKTAAGCRRHRCKAGVSGGRCGRKRPSAPAGERRCPEAGGQGLPAGAEVLRRQRRHDRRTGLLPVHRGPHRRAGAQRPAHPAH